VSTTVTASSTSFTVWDPHVFGIVIVADVAVVASAPVVAEQLAWLAGPARKAASSEMDATFTPAGRIHSTVSGRPSAASAGVDPTRFLKTTGGSAGGGGFPPAGGGAEPLPPPPQPARTQIAMQSSFFTTRNVAYAGAARKHFATRSRVLHARLLAPGLAGIKAALSAAGKPVRRYLTN
jgi:hypothetical protein